MEWVALATWVATAAGGLVLLGLWLKHGGMAQSGAPGARIRAGRILGHFALAAIGLVVWVVYVASDVDALAWVALGILAVVALVGFAMLATWMGRRRGGTPVAVGAAAAEPAEQRFPVALVGAHGVLAASTLVLVLLTAAGA